ncbi:MAG: hypothetical protein HEQ23_14665 [Tepidisphaera sp.]
MRRAVICLLSGTFLTAATATLAAIWAPLPKQLSLTLSSDHDQTVSTLQGRTPFTTRLLRALDNLGYWDLTVERWSGWGCELTEMSSHPLADVLISGSGPAKSGPTELRTGWPFLSFSAAPALFLADQQSSWQQGLLVTKPWVRNLPSNSMALALGSPPTTIVPLKPEMLPLLGNIAFWGGVSYLLMYFPLDARRILRRRRGKCTQCGYPVRNLTHCPECGPDQTSTAK